MNELKDNKPSKRSAATSSADHMPAHVVRQGAIAASIWKRQTSSGHTYYDYSLSRSWKSKSSERTGYSTNFSEKNEKALVEVVQAASAWISAQNQNEATEPAREPLAA